MIVFEIVIALLLVWLTLVLHWRLGQIVEKLDDGVGWLYSALTDIAKALTEEPEVNLPDETIAKLKVFAARSFSKQSDDPAQQYAAGLQDGTTAAAQYVLGELKEEKADA